MEQNKYEDQIRPLSDEEMAQAGGGISHTRPSKYGGARWQCEKCGKSAKQEGTCSCGGTIIRIDSGKVVRKDGVFL